MPTTFYFQWDWEWDHCYSNSIFDKNFILILIIYISPMTTIALLSSNAWKLTFTPAAGGQCTSISPPRETYCFHCLQQIGCACLASCSGWHNKYIDWIYQQIGDQLMFLSIFMSSTLWVPILMFRTSYIMKIGQLMISVWRILCVIDTTTITLSVCSSLFFSLNVQWHFHVAWVSSTIFLFTWVSKAGNSFCYQSHFPW